MTEKSKFIQDKEKREDYILELRVKHKLPWTTITSRLGMSYSGVQLAFARAADRKNGANIERMRSSNGQLAGN